MTLGIRDIQHKRHSAQQNYHYAGCGHVECRDLLIVMLGVVMLSVVMLSIVMLSVVILSVIMLSDVMLSL